MSFSSQLATLQDSQEDFEWYPTTKEILNTFLSHLESSRITDYGERSHVDKISSFLDIGAGDGKVIEHLFHSPVFEHCQFYAIEKSHRLIELLPKEVFVIGVDFWNATLIEKKIGIIFSNPPYKQFVPWVTKIIKEADHDTEIYLVLPNRWKNQTEINEAIELRRATIEVLGSFDFEDAEDRKARAKVELIKVTLGKGWKNDPFVTFFDETFSYPEEKKHSDFKELEQCSLVKGPNFVERLVEIYNLRMNQLQENYRAICSLDREILDEFEISKSNLIKSLQIKLDNAKKLFWGKLFDGIDEITNRLTTSSRKNILNRLNSETGIEFTRDNVYSVVLWAIKNANSYFDPQFIEVYEKMVTLANIENYKSNQRVFNEKDFRYDYYSKATATHYFLKIGHRIVLESGYMGLRTDYGGRISPTESATNFINDLLTIANNMGFSESGGPNPETISDSAAVNYTYLKNNKRISLFEVRVFLNGNMHLRFNPDFVHAMNVLHGRLKGWVRDEKQAEQETGSTPEISKQMFDLDNRLNFNTLQLTNG